MTTATTVGVAAGCGLGAATGLLLLITTLGRQARPGNRRSRTGKPGLELSRATLVRAGLAVGAGVLAGVVTGWVAAVPVVAAAGWWLPRLAGPDRAQARRLARIEAVASWTEMLRDVLAAAAGLEQAILATTPLAPEPIRGELTTLAARVESGQRLAPALRQLAGELDDATADLVLAALILAADREARQLGALLGSLADTAREHAAMRLRVETGRARTRTSVRVIVATTVGFATAVVLFNRDYLAPFATPTGQLALLTIGALFAAGFAWLTHIAEHRTDTRLLHHTPAADTQTPTGASNGGEPS